eukprot:scaffold12974_cov78-Cylindrotheca_fusiformis.AAC.1
MAVPRYYDIQGSTSREETTTALSHERPSMKNQMKLVNEIQGRGIKRKMANKMAHIARRSKGWKDWALFAGTLEAAAFEERELPDIREYFRELWSDGSSNRRIDTEIRQILYQSNMIDTNRNGNDSATRSAAVDKYPPAVQEPLPCSLLGRPRKRQAYFVEQEYPRRVKRREQVSERLEGRRPKDGYKHEATKAELVLVGEQVLSSSTKYTNQQLKDHLTPEQLSDINIRKLNIEGLRHKDKATAIAQNQLAMERAQRRKKPDKTIAPDFEEEGAME